jgi:hypothetical protein
MLRFILAVLLLVQINAFAPRTSTFRSASSVKGARPPSAAAIKTSFALHMAEEDKQVAAAKDTPVISADGTFYDDQMDSSPVKEGLSDSMRDRLMREASTGLDSDKKQNNTILYISVVVAVLVVLGGKDILY